MSSGRSRFAQTAIVHASTMLALGLLGWVLAYWTLAWFAPAPLPRSMRVSPPPGRLAAAGDLFGQGQSGAQAQSPTALAVKLLGVIAGQPHGSGYALLQLDGKDTHVVRAGGELAPGIRVESVLPQRVILLRGGARETLAWPHAGSGVATAATAANGPVR
jgi:general secretion pathway protein C